MARHDIIVVGGSAGAIEAACAILGELPADPPASVFVVQHIGSNSELAEVLQPNVEQLATDRLGRPGPF